MDRDKTAKHAAVCREGEQHMTRLNDRIGGGAEKQIEQYRTAAEGYEAQLGDVR